MRKGKPFLEVFASALNEDYGFPVLEFVVFAYTVEITIALETFGHGPEPSGDPALIVLLTNPISAFMLVGLMFGLLVLKNIAYSFGNDLERGVIVSFLSYPLRRRSLLTAKLLSSIGVPFMLFASIQVFVIFLLVPGMVSPHVVLLAILSVLSYPILVASIVLVLTIFFKRGSKALFVGIVLYFASGFSWLLLLMTGPTGLKAAAIIYPSIALQLHYKTGWDPSVLRAWTPSFNEALLYIGAGYALSISILAAAYLYFERRLEM